MLYVAIDRTQWGCINLLMISLIWDKRAIPVYWGILPKLGSSNLQEQQVVLLPVFRLLKGYKIVTLGDREFCSVDLANWLREQKVYFCLRLRRDEYIQVEGELWLQLQNLGLAPGVSLFFQGVKVRKTKGFAGFNLACKWKRKYRGAAPKERASATPLPHWQSPSLAPYRQNSLDSTQSSFPATPLPIVLPRQFYQYQ